MVNKPWRKCKVLKPITQFRGYMSLAVAQNMSQRDNINCDKTGFDMYQKCNG